MNGEIATGLTIGLMRCRWRSEWPYVGHTVESLRRKIGAAATTPETKIVAAREFEIRARTERAG